MPIYNNPALGRAAESIASLFAPPSGAEAAGWASANAKNAEAKRLADFYAGAPEMDAAAYDRVGPALGLWTPNQGVGVTMRGQDIGSADARYGVDVGAATSRTNNAADNERAIAERRMMEAGSLERQFAEPIKLGQGETAFLPGQTAGATGLASTLSGVPKPLSESEALAEIIMRQPEETQNRFANDKYAPSETQVKGQERRGLAAGGMLTDQMVLDAIVGAETPVQVVGKDGTSRYSTPGAAVRTGAQAFVNKGAQAKPENAQFTYPDGTSGPAIQDESGRWLNARDGSPLTGEFNITKMAAPTGANEDVGIGRAANNQVEKALIDTEVARGTAASLRKFIASSPASQGAVGWLRGTAQNVVQTGGELGQFLGGRMAEVARDIESGAADSGLAGAFDPSIPAIEMLSNLLAFQYAKTTTGERLSNEMLRATKAALGLDSLTANQADALARLDQAIEQIDNQARILQGVRSNGIDSIGRTRGATETSPASSRDSSGPLPAGVDPSDWQYMTPQERALFQ